MGFRATTVRNSQDDDGTLLIGTPMDRQWFLDQWSDGADGHFKQADLDAADWESRKPFAALDENREALKFGPGGLSDPDTYLEREGAAALAVRNAADDGYGTIQGGDPSGDDDYSTKRYVDEQVNLAVPTGTILPYGGATPPSGYLFCHGQAESRNTHASLFGVLGTAYGSGDGSTTFNVPDLRGRFPLGKADAGTGSTLGESGGSLNHTHTYSDIPAHAHSVDVGATTSTSNGAHVHSIDPPSTGSSSAGDHSHSVDPPSTTSASAGGHSHSVDPPSTGSSSAGGHSHSVNPPSKSTTTTGSHRHGLLYNNVMAIGSTKVATSAGSLDSSHMADAGNHSHSVDIGSFTSGSVGSHTHSTNIASFTSDSVADHTHDTNIGSFTSGSAGSHTHSVNVAAFDSASAGAHTHSTDPAAVSTTTVGVASPETDPANPPYLVVNYIIRT